MSQQAGTEWSGQGGERVDFEQLHYEYSRCQKQLMSADVNMPGLGYVGLFWGIMGDFGPQKPSSTTPC
jgi:hypothetical protein